MTLTATEQNTAGQAVFGLIESPNPFMVEGPIAWLSTDPRVFQLRPGESLIGLSSVTMGSSQADASTFIEGVINGFNGMGPFNHPFDLISAERNLAIVQSDNPGTVASHRIANTFDVKATKPTLPAGWHPDELMIDWGGTPPDSDVQIYLPAADADEILRMAASLYGVTTLKKVDDHTLSCKASGMTWVPLPPGSGPNYAGLMTIDLPDNVKRGQSFTVVVKQVTSGIATQLPPPPPVINAERGVVVGKEGGHKEGGHAEARRIHGAYQLTIPVTTKTHMLPAEERLFSVLRWIEQSIDSGDRWLPVFERYVATVGDRVKALGGDPGRIRPSPDGSGVKGEHPPHPKPAPHHRGERGEQRLHLTGKVNGLVYDRFGDFDGFMLDTEDGERRFHCREQEMAELLYEAWSERVLVTVVVEEDNLRRPEKIILRSPRPPRLR